MSNDKPRTQCTVELIAKLTADPQERTTQKGGQMVSCNAMGPGSEGSPWWIKLLSTRSQVLETFTVLHKGDFVTLRGSMKRGSGYTNRDGVVVEGGTEVWVDEIDMVTGGEPVAAPEQATAPDDYTDLPF